MGGRDMSINPWTLDGLITKVQDDLELHSENFVTRPELTRFANDAITDAEELIVDLFSDYFLSETNINMVVGQNIIPLPEDIYECRVRGFYYDENSFSAGSAANMRNYKLKKIHIENIADVYSESEYQYRLINTSALGPHIKMYPPSREETTTRFKMWYTREAKRLVNDGDILDIPRPQFVISHMKVAVMSKEGDPLLEAESLELARQRQKLEDSLQRLSDDEEDEYIHPNDASLWEAYGDGIGGFHGGAY
jgi:hypothetical protein